MADLFSSRDSLCCEGCVFDFIVIPPFAPKCFPDRDGLKC